MKKWIAMLLCAALLSTLAGCRRDRTESAAQDESVQEETTQSETAAQDTAQQDTAQQGNAQESGAQESNKQEDTAQQGNAQQGNAQENSAQEGNASQDNAQENGTQEGAAAAAGGMPEQLRRAFKEAVADESGGDMRELAEEIADACALPFEVTVTEAAEGPLAGFGDAAVEGFSEGAAFAPTVSTIPFIGYVFRAEDEAAAKTLLDTLSEQADRRWNVCTEADAVVSEQVGNIAFFAMTAESFDE